MISVAGSVLIKDTLTLSCHPHMRRHISSCVSFFYLCTQNISLPPIGLLVKAFILHLQSSPDSSTVGQLFLSMAVHGAAPFPHSQPHVQLQQGSLLVSCIPAAALPT